MSSKKVKSDKVGMDESFREKIPQRCKGYFQEDIIDGASGHSVEIVSPKRKFYKFIISDFLEKFKDPSNI